VLKQLWPLKTGLSNRIWFRKTQIQRGMKWYEYGHISKEKFSTPLSIAFAFVATHNHFVLDRGGKVFKAARLRSSNCPPTPPRMTTSPFLGLLNSSTACFCTQQTFQRAKAVCGGIGGGLATEGWEHFYEFTGTGLQQYPVATSSVLAFAREISDVADCYSAMLPARCAQQQNSSRHQLDY
jgi:hypothetical protein